VEEAVKMVISGGIVTPPDLRSEEEKATPVVSAATFEDIELLREDQRTPLLVAKNIPEGADAKRDPLENDEPEESDPNGKN